MTTRRQNHRINRQNANQRKRERGECLDCPLPAEFGRVYCTEHLAYYRSQTKRRYQERKATQ